MLTCTRRLEFDAAHRVFRHESKCASLHGHRYVVEVTCRAPKLDSVGRIVDFGVIKERLGKWIDDHWDHTTLVSCEDTDLMEWCRNQHEKHGKRAPYPFPGEPTAENIAEHLYRIATDMLRTSDVSVAKIRVYETPNCYADFEAS